MKKSSLLSLLFVFFIFNSLLKNNLAAQSTSLTITYSGFQACGGCTVCGADYWCFNTLSSYCGNTGPCGTQSFVDPVPAGNIVTNIQVQYYSADCSGGTLTASMNGNTFPTVNEGNTGCLCSNNPCAISATTTNTFPCGIPGYNYGASNNLQLCTGSDVCINKLVLVFTYAPANQATPATQPGAISGNAVVCAGTPYTYSIPAVSNASSYTWTLPPGWVLNSGQGTTSITATPGSAGNICVTASNLCGTSAATCLPISLSTPSTAPASATANPTTLCAGTSTLTVNGGSLGAGANWTWYTGGCGGAVVGSGSSITVTPGSTTTYYVGATGGCGNTACASTAVTVTALTSPFTTNSSNQCLTGNSFTFTNSGSSGGGVTQTWDFGDGVGTSTSVNATYSYPTPGTYTVTHTVNQAPCSSTTTTVVTVSAPPNVNAGGTPGSLTCTNLSTILAGSSSTGGATLTWDGPGTVNAPDPATVTLAGTYTITANSGGCLSTATVIVSSNTTPPNSGITAPNTVIDCANPSVTLTGTSSTGGASMSWSGPSGSLPGNPIAVGTAGTYTLTVTDPSNGCTSTQTQAVTSNGAVPTISLLSSDDTLTCTVSSITLTGGSSTGGTTLSWAGPSGPLAGNPIISSTVGTYTLTVTDPGTGCSVTQTFSIAQNTTVPSAVVNASQPAITCVNLSSSLTASSNAGNPSYSWAGPSGGIAGNPVSVSTGGTYTVTVTDNANGCTATQTVSITTDTVTPAVNITPASPTINCTSSTVTLTGNATNVTYNWSGAGSGTTSTQSATAPGNYILTVTSNQNGCTNSANVNVVIDTITPNASAVAGGTITCTNPNATLNGSSVTSSVSYSWAGPGGFTSANQNPTTAQSGTYTVTVTNTVNGCTNTATCSVTIDTLSPNASASSAGIISCSSSSALLNGNSTTGSGVTYSWAGPGGFTSSTQNPSASQAGNYTVTVTNPVNGCTNTATATVNSNSVTPNVNAGANDTLPCGIGATVNLNGSSSTGGVTYLWTGPSGFTSTLPNPSVSATGQYTLVVTDPANGCLDSATVIISPTNVIAGFTANPTSGFVPLTVNFTNTSTGATSYIWSFGDSTTSTSVNPSDIYSATGTYTVMLIAMNGSCVDTATATIVVNDNFSVLIPNVFTPNGDGSNDFFFITTTGVTELSGDIFNRWGEKIFSLVGINASWDGKNLSGANASSGTYYIILNLKGVDGKEYERKAYIGLFR